MDLVQLENNKRIKYLTGNKYGRLLVLGDSGERRKLSNGHTGAVLWKCECECGNIINVTGNSLQSGHTKSCGCINKENRIKNKTYGLSQSRIYSIYRSMIRRCYNDSHSSYANYGQRGIIICEEWMNDFINFYDWANKNGYQDDLSIDRIDNDGDYEPNNCKFSNNIEQNNNTNKNKHIVINGVSKTMVQWARDSGINYGTFTERVYAGWTGEKLLSKVR